jgi:hypothetical protein
MLFPASGLLAALSLLTAPGRDGSPRTCHKSGAHRPRNGTH